VASPTGGTSSGRLRGLMSLTLIAIARILTRCTCRIPYQEPTQQEIVSFGRRCLCSRIVAHLSLDNAILGGNEARPSSVIFKDRGTHETERKDGPRTIADVLS